MTLRITSIIAMNGFLCRIRIYRKQTVIFLLGSWPSHAEYHQYIAKVLSVMARDNPYALLEYEDSVLSPYILDLDPLKSIIEPLYSSTGRQSSNQSEIFRSLVLMNDLCYSLDKWLRKLSNNLILQAGCGFTTSFPQPQLITTS